MPDNVMRLQELQVITDSATGDIIGLVGPNEKKKYFAALDVAANGSASLTAGQQATVSVPEGYSLVVTGDASSAATITRMSDGQTFPIGTTTPPTSGIQSYTIVCSVGTVNTSVQDGSLPSSQAQAAGYGVAIAGDSITQNNYLASIITAISRSGGVGSVTFSAATNLWPGAQIRIVNVQNSPTAPTGLPMEGTFTVLANPSGNTWTYTDPRPDVASGALGTYPRAINLQCYANNGYFTMLNIFTKQKFDLLGISAATGRYTQDILSNIGEVLNLGAKFIFVLGGTNDVLSVGGSLYGDIPATTTIANLSAIYAKVRASGANVVAVLVPPLSGSAWTAAAAAKITVINNWIRKWVRSNPGSRLFDYYSPLVDPANASAGKAKTGMIAAADGIHPSPKGAGTAAWANRAMFDDLPLIDTRVTSPADAIATQGAVPTAATSDNVQLYAPWTGTGGTINANVGGTAFPNKWAATKVGTTNGAFVASAAARSDGYGYNAVATLTAAVAGDGFKMDTGSYSFHPSVTAGSFMQAEWSIDATGVSGSNLNNVDCYIGLAVGAGYTNKGLYGLANVNSTTGEAIDFDWSGVIRTPRIQFPTAPTSCIAICTGTANAAGTAVVVSCGRQSVRIN